MELAEGQHSGKKWAEEGFLLLPSFMGFALVGSSQL